MHHVSEIVSGTERAKKHKCGYAECPSCYEYVNVATHKCFIQVVKSPEEEKQEKRKKRKKAKRGAAAGLATLEANGQGMDVVDEKDKQPLLVFFDIEAMQDTGRHIPNLLIAETEHDSRPVRFKGEHCIRDFLEWLDTLTEDNMPPVAVIAHNLDVQNSRNGMLNKWRKM